MILSMKQHYIPRCYLKQFSGNPKSVYTYDKISSKAYRASLMSVCCEDDIYLKLRLLVDLEDIKWMKFTNG